MVVEVCGKANSSLGVGQEQAGNNRPSWIQPHCGSRYFVHSEEGAEPRPWEKKPRDHPPFPGRTWSVA